MDGKPARLLFRFYFFLISIFVCLLPFALSAAEIRILFSTCLNGNLDGCTCKTTPVSGLAKRGAFIAEYRKKHPEMILLDSGDLIDDPKDTAKAAAIFNSYRLLQYDAVLPGDQDVMLGLDELKMYSKTVPIIAANLEQVDGLLFKNQNRIFQPYLKLTRNRTNVIVLGVLHREAFRFAKLKQGDAIEIAPPETAIGDAPASDLLILLSHGGMDVDRNLTRNISRPLILIGGHDQSLIKNGPGIRWTENVWYFQSGRDGNMLGEIVVETKSGGKYEIKSHRLIEFDYATSLDHPQIRQMTESIEKK